VISVVGAAVDLVSRSGGGGLGVGASCVGEDKGEREPDDKREREKIRERECHVIDPHLPFSTNQIVEFSCLRIVCFWCTVD
jgi:hypothetical protein